MNKTAIKNFAIWARNKLIADIHYRAGLLGITAEGIANPLPQSTGDTEFYDIGTAEPYSIHGQAVKQRKRLVELLNKKAEESDFATAYKYVLEEVAYTWFNRLIAVRFMEVNDYLPSHIRVLSSESGKAEPDLVTTPFDADLEFTEAERASVIQMKQDNKLDELFRLLFIKQCNALNDILPALFEQTNDYTELLLNLSFVDQEGVVYHLTNDIPESNFDITHTDEDGKTTGQVEIIGWLYQYYNTEPKNVAFAKNGKITKEEIPAVTQLFTPDWIVRYMVENSLGRIFIDKQKEQGLFADGRGQDEMIWDEIEAKRIANEKTIADEMNWKYYLPEAAQTKEVRQQLEEVQRKSEYKDVRDIRVIDPCMGSGHILVYAFDVLMQMYENDGYSQRDAAQSILENNLYGLDIDDRAAQLAYFAVMMKARQYDRRIFSRGIQPHVYAIVESNDIDTFTQDYFTGGGPKLKAALDSIISDLCDAKEYGSILTVAPVDFAALYARAGEVQNDVSLHREAVLTTILPLIRVAEALARQYDVVVTNPPYMGSRGSMNPKLYDYVETNYPRSKADLYSVFIEKCEKMTRVTRYYAMITQHGWMFLTSFSNLRNALLNDDIVNLLHLGPRAFDEINGEVVQSASFVNRRTNLAAYRATYFRLISGNSEKEKEQFFGKETYRYTVAKQKFNLLTEKSIAYWLSDTAFSNFDNPTLGEFAKPRQGMATSDNDRFLRLWYEVNNTRIYMGAKTSEDAVASGAKWFPYNKGGGFRKWYGNNDYLINWENDGFEVKALAERLYRCVTRTIKNIQFYFRPGVTWSTLASGSFNARYSGAGFLFDTKGSTCFFDDDRKIPYFTSLLNSVVANEYLKVLAPTLDYNAGSVAKLPVKYDESRKSEIIPLFDGCVRLSRMDWDSYETSWDFKRHPLVRLQLAGAYAWGDKLHVMRLSSAYKAWQLECEGRFEKLKANEEDLNRIFIDIYGLQGELTPDVADKDVTVHRIFDTKDNVPQSMQGSNYVCTKRDEIVSLLSYAVGCMFGRYSLDVEGLVYAGGDWDYSKYTTYIPDADNILPITDEEYFKDDIVGMFCAWVKKVYGPDTLEENLDFIAKALGNKGNSSREVIRNYFLKDFFKDHCKTYQKRPIYWLFDSGKQNGFKALVYLHRYNADTIGNLRVDYLHRMQRVYESEINRMQDMIDNSTNAREVAVSTKRKDKLQKQLKECREYDEKIGHLALSRIELDLDDGVKVNYRKVQTARDGKFYEVLADSKNIMGKQREK